MIYLISINQNEIDSLMIVTAKQKRKISVPTFINVGFNEVVVTDNFKLLGVLIEYNN